MAFAHLSQNFQRLPGSKKLVGIGSLILAISTLLPWYADLDAFRVGDMFLGVTGPASFVGIVILLLGLFSFAIFLGHLLQKRIPKLPVKESVFHLFVSLESLMLLFIVNSIYFHPKFGVNISLKESRFGMMIALLSGIALAIGGYYELRKERKTDDYIGKLEPLVTMKPEAAPPSYAKPAPPQAPARPMPTVSRMPQALERKHQPFTMRQGMVERAQQETSSKVSQEPLHFSDAPKTPEPPKTEKPETKEGGGSFMIRTDL